METISVQNLSKKYRIRNGQAEPYMTLRDALSNGIRSLGRRMPLRNRAPRIGPAFTGVPGHDQVNRPTIGIQPVSTGAQRGRTLATPSTPSAAASNQLVTGLTHVRASPEYDVRDRPLPRPSGLRTRSASC